MLLQHVTHAPQLDQQSLTIVLDALSTYTTPSLLSGHTHPIWFYHDMSWGNGFLPTGYCENFCLFWMGDALCVAPSYLMTQQTYITMLMHVIACSVMGQVSRLSFDEKEKRKSSYFFLRTEISNQHMLLQPSPLFFTLIIFVSGCKSGCCHPPLKDPSARRPALGQYFEVLKCVRCFE
jgi:hypothetical protein